MYCKVRRHHEMSPTSSSSIYSTPSGPAETEGHATKILGAAKTPNVEEKEKETDMNCRLKVTVR